MAREENRRLAGGAAPVGEVLGDAVELDELADARLLLVELLARRHQTQHDATHVTEDGGVDQRCEQPMQIDIVCFLIEYASH